MDFVNKIESKLKQGKKKEADAMIFYFLMKEMNQQYSEIMNMPTVLVLELIRVHEEMCKKQEKAMKKKK